MPIWRKAVNLLLKETIALLFGAHLFYTEGDKDIDRGGPVSYTHLRAHETVLDLVCRLLLEKKNKTISQ